MAWKYVHIFACRHYLLQEANSFPKAKHKENCGFRGKDNVQGQIFTHIFAPNRGYCFHEFSSLQIFCDAHEKKIIISLLYTMWDVFFWDCSLVQLNAQKKDFHSSVTTTKTLSNLDLNLKQRILVVDVRFENWGISLSRVIVSDITQF